MILPLFIGARIVFVAVTTVTFAIALLTYRRVRTTKSLLITIGFTLFFVHGLISIPEIFNRTYNFDFTDSIHLLIDAVAVLFLLWGTLHKDKE